jgi:hypothetical protein
MKVHEQKQENLPGILISEPDTTTHQTWEAFGWQVAQNFQVDFAQTGAGVFLELPGASVGLIVQNVGDGFRAIAYGERVEDDLLPQVQIVFDASGESGWTLVWVEYLPEIWHEFILSHDVLIPDHTQHERYVDFEDFAGYVLARLEKEGWTEYAMDVSAKKNGNVSLAGF